MPFISYACSKIDFPHTLSISNPWRKHKLKRAWMKVAVAIPTPVGNIAKSDLMADSRYEFKDWLSTYLFIYKLVPITLEWIAVVSLIVYVGVFWIDWTSVLKFYDVAYMNWKPELFIHKWKIHEWVNTISGCMSVTSGVMFLQLLETYLSWEGLVRH